MRGFVRFLVLSLVLLAIALVSALTAMRIAIHGQEVAIPRLVGLTDKDAEGVALENGLLVRVENRFYSDKISAGAIVSQLPVAGTRVRRGWRVRLAVSLGPQHVLIPKVAGQTLRAAELNLARHGLEIGVIARMRMSGIPAEQVIAQSPPPNAAGIAAPKVDLLVSAGEEPLPYVVPNFVGNSFAAASQTLQQAGMQVQRVETHSTLTAGVLDLTSPASNETTVARPPVPGTVLSQTPPPGRKVASGTVVQLQVLNSHQ